MNADDIVTALARHKWPDQDYLLIREAPLDSGRQGRKLDLLAITLWQSRGLQRDGVEIKVSLSDWKRELLNAEKADAWFRYVNRFWVAVPAELADKIIDELPLGWGLLTCTEKTVKVALQANKHDAEPFTWPQQIGLMRASADAGANALRRAHHDGWEVGKAEGREEARRRSHHFSAESLGEKLAMFEKLTGIDLTRKGHEDAESLAAMFKLARHWGHSPEDLARTLDRFVTSVGRLHRTSQETLQEFRDGYRPKENQ